jgi:CxxC-x17-CxxC domain-containing protein
MKPLRQENRFSNTALTLIEVNLEKSKIRITSTKVLCAKCGKEHYVDFVADGHRKYYCDECLKQMHLDRKKGKIKKVFNDKLKKDQFEFICDICGNLRRASYTPKQEKGLIWCKECESKQKDADRKKNRGNIVIAKKPKES